MTTDLFVETVNESPRLVMITAPNSGPKTLDGTHTYVIGTGAAYVIDPGPDMPVHYQSVARWLKGNCQSVLGILLTHGHPDHAPGATGLRKFTGAPVLCSSAMPESVKQRLKPNSTFDDGDIFVLNGDVLRVVATPGHTSDHVSFWLEGAGILFSGDTILGQGSTLIAPPEGDMAAYMRSLEAIRGLGPRMIAPGHGAIIREPIVKINEYLEHRRQRERQILAVLASGPSDARGLVTRVYVDLDARLHELAVGSVEAQLAKLISEGLVETHDGSYYLIHTG